MTIASFLETLLGGLMAGMLYSLVALGFVLMGVVLVLNVCISALRRWRQRIDGSGADPVQGLLR